MPSAHTSAPPAAQRILATWRDGLLRLARALPGRRGPTKPMAPPAAPSARPVEAPAPGPAPVAWSDRLWGEGFVLPGGVAEINRLSGLLPLSPTTTLLLLGQDAGGAARSIAQRRSAWVAAHQHEPLLAERMTARLRPLGRRVQVQPWDPAAPSFRPGYHHHALALEPLRAGADPARLLAALAAALKPGGQFVLLDLVAGTAAGDPALARWMALEGRTAPPPGHAALEATLAAAGFVLHVAEDAGPRHNAATLEAWVALLDGLRNQARPSAAALASLVAEAELWLLRQRLLGSGALRLFRWHATLAR
jgi:hypothetical protein